MLLVSIFGFWELPILCHRLVKQAEHDLKLQSFPSRLIFKSLIGGFGIEMTFVSAFENVSKKQ